jgi:signal transduction histidine kinase
MPAPDQGHDGAGGGGSLLRFPESGSRPHLPARPLPAGDAPETPAHIAQFYETDAFLEEAVAAFCREGVASREAIVLVATPAHRAGIEARLHEDGIDLAKLRAAGRYIALDAAETLARIAVAGEPDGERFRQVIDPILVTAGRGRSVRVFGEMVGLLALAGNAAAAVRLEELWCEAQARHGFTLLCGWPMAPLGDAGSARVVEQVSALHTHVVPSERFSGQQHQDTLHRAIVALQQKERWLAVEIAERKRVEALLQEALAAERTARAATETALKLRDEFLAVAAHELRNPLAVIRGRAQLILRRVERGRTTDPVAAHDALGAISTQVDRLVRLLDRLLDVSRLETGRVHLEPEWVDLSALCAHVVSDLQAAWPRAAIALEAPPALAARVDPLRIEQALANLVENAVRHGRSEHPVDVTLRQPAPDHVEIAVRDRGPGIPEDHRERLFERFFQVAPARADGGLGLGLYVSRQIVELHGGAIHAEHPADGGVRFLVRLPLRPDVATGTGASRLAE